MRLSKLDFFDIEPPRNQSVEAYNLFPATFNEWPSQTPKDKTNRATCRRRSPVPPSCVAQAANGR